MRPLSLRLMVIWICAFMPIRARFILVQLNENEIGKDEGNETSQELNVNIFYIVFIKVV